MIDCVSRRAQLKSAQKSTLAAGGCAPGSRPTLLVSAVLRAIYRLGKT
jgi:hypothetical protein